jgi:hypothetical protein
MHINGKRVIDATKPLRISISKADAAGGRTKDSARCAAARAIIRTVANAKAARVHLGRTYIETEKAWVRYKTPDSLKVEIVLYAPAPTDRLGSRPRPTGTGRKTRRPHIARIHHQIEGVRAHGANK